MKTVGSHLASFIAAGGTLQRRLRPFARFIGLLVAVVLAYGWLFHVIMAWEGQEHSWFTGIYWALTVMSTLGFGDITFQSDLGRIFSTGVLLTGIVLLLVIMPSLFIQHVYAPWLDERTRGRIRELRELPKDIRDHVLICADDPIALGLIHQLRVAGIPAFLVEPDSDRALALRDADVPVIAGEIDSVETYRAARIEHARLVFANASDTVNSNIVLTVRELSESVPIAAVVASEDSIDVLELSGATHVLPLKQRLGEHLASRAGTGRARVNVIGGFHDLLLGEFPVQGTAFEGITVAEMGLPASAGVEVVGIWDHARLAPPQPERRLTSTCLPLVMGTAAELEALEASLVSHELNPNPVLVIGGGKVGRAAARALKQRGVPVHVVERKADLEPKIRGIPDRLFIGDAADRHVLVEAGIEDTPSILLTTHDDAVNIYLSVYCRRLNPGARILTRVTHERNIEAIRRAGADFELSYAAFGVQTVFSIVRGREIVVLGEDVNLFYLKVPPSLQGRSLAEAEIGTRSGLHPIALRENGRVVRRLEPGKRLPADAELVVLGSTEARARFHKVYR